MAAGVMRWPSDVTLFFRENGIALEKAQRQHREGHGRSLNPTPVGSATRNRVPQSGSAINSNQTGYPSPNPSCSDHCTFKCPRIKFKRFQRILQLTIHLIRVDSSPCFAMLRHTSAFFSWKQKNNGTRFQQQDIRYIPRNTCAAHYPNSPPPPLKE